MSSAAAVPYRVPERILPWEVDVSDPSMTRIRATGGVTESYTARQGESIRVCALGEKTRVTITGTGLRVFIHGDLAFVFVNGENNQVFREGEYVHISVNGVPAHNLPRREIIPIVPSSSPSPSRTHIYGSDSQRGNIA